MFLYKFRIFTLYYENTTRRNFETMWTLSSVSVVSPISQNNPSNLMKHTTTTPNNINPQSANYPNNLPNHPFAQFPPATNCSHPQALLAHLASIYKSGVPGSSLGTNGGILGSLMRAQHGSLAGMVQNGPMISPPDFTGISLIFNTHSRYYLLSSTK